MNDIFEEFARLVGRLMASHWLRKCRDEDAESTRKAVADQVTRKGEVQENGRDIQGDLSKAVRHLPKRKDFECGQKGMR